MEHVLRETDQVVDTQQKYGKRLDALGELMDLDSQQRAVINEELVEMRQKRNDKLASIQANFKQMQDREKEISTGLIHTKTGKELPEKVSKIYRQDRGVMAVPRVLKFNYHYRVNGRQHFGGFICDCYVFFSVRFIVKRAERTHVSPNHYRFNFQVINNVKKKYNYSRGFWQFLKIMMTIY